MGSSTPVRRSAGTGIIFLRLPFQGRSLAFTFAPGAGLKTRSLVVAVRVLGSKVITMLLANSPDDHSRRNSSGCGTNVGAPLAAAVVVEVPWPFISALNFCAHFMTPAEVIFISVV